jgi:hypothetical protein
MFSSIVSYSIIFEHECSECLYENSEDATKLDEEKKSFTVLYRKLSARYWAPLSLIWFLERLIWVSAYMKVEIEME